MADQGIMLYTGCGRHRMNGFVHMDVSVGKRYHKSGARPPHPEILGDITRHIPLPDQSVDLAFSRDTLEHLSYHDLMNHLLEVRRVLKPNGFIRMVFPCLDNMVAGYLKKVNCGILREMEKFMPYENHVDEFICQLLYHDHRYLHNFDTMSRALERAGFGHVRTCTPGDSKVTRANEQLRMAEMGRLLEMTVEARKLDVAPTVSFVETNPLPRGFIRKFLARHLNIAIVPFDRKRPRFPVKLWFVERWNRFRQDRRKNIVPYTVTKKPTPDLSWLDDLEVGLFSGKNDQSP